MTLKQFILIFIEPNTLTRLWYKCDGGHEMIKDIEQPQMEWQLVESEYADNVVTGITDILIEGHYVEAVNIVIKKK